MSIGLISALLLLFVGGGAMISAALMSAPATSRTMARRVDMIAAVHIVPVAGNPTRSWLTSAGAVLETVFAFRREREWGTHSSAVILLVIGLISGGAAWMVLAEFLQLPGGIVALVAVAAFVGVPHLKLAREQARSDANFTDRFPDAIDSIIRMLRAGLPISAAIRAVAAEPSPPVDAVFRQLADQMDVGLPLEEALADAGHRIELADFRFFTVAVALQHSTGGNLTTTLDILSEIIRKRRGMRLKASAVTAEVRMTAYILAAIPIVIVLGLLVVNPNYLSPLIHDPRGNMIVAAAISSLSLGFLTMRRMMRHAIRM